MSWFCERRLVLFRLAHVRPFCTPAMELQLQAPRVERIHLNVAAALQILLPHSLRAVLVVVRESHSLRHDIPAWILLAHFLFGDVAFFLQPVADRALTYFQTKISRQGILHLAGHDSITRRPHFEECFENRCIFCLCGLTPSLLPTALFTLPTPFLHALENSVWSGVRNSILHEHDRCDLCVR